jgi:hypothetical protein
MAAIPAVRWQGWKSWPEDGSFRKQQVVAQ